MKESSHIEASDKPRSGLSHRLVGIFWRTLNQPLERVCVKYVHRVRMEGAQWRLYKAISWLEFWTRNKAKQYRRIYIPNDKVRDPAT